VKLLYEILVLTMLLKKIAFILVFLSYNVISHACWLDQKEKSIKRVESYMVKKHLDPHLGLSKHEIIHAINTAPSGVGWLIRKVHGVEGVLNDCDLNGDDIIHMQEARRAKRCADTCWKQIGILTFLN
jgi:hypothetical protein